MSEDIHLRLLDMAKKKKGSGIADLGREIINKILPVRKDAPPKVRQFIDKYGKKVITGMDIFRVPIFKTIDKVLNLISLGKWQQNKTALNYEDLFHLYMYIRVDTGEVFRIEKNHVVVVQLVQSVPNLEETKALRAESMPVQPAIRPLTIANIFGNAIEYQGLPQFWVYDPVTANCQAFVSAMLNGSGLMTPELNKFIQQCAECVLKDHSRVFATFLTDIASRADRLISGKGIQFNNTKSLGQYDPLARLAS